MFYRLLVVELRPFAGFVKVVVGAQIERLVPGKAPGYETTCLNDTWLQGGMSNIKKSVY